MPTAALHSHETELADGDRRRELADESDHRPQSASCLDKQAERCGTPADSPTGKTHFQPSRIRWADEYTNVPEACGFGGPGDHPRRGYPLISHDPQLPETDPGLAPGKRLGRHCRRIALAEAFHGVKIGPHPGKLGLASRRGATGAQSRPCKQRNHDCSGGNHGGRGIDPRQAESRGRGDRRDGRAHQSLAWGRTKLSWKRITEP